MSSHRLQVRLLFVASALIPMLLMSIAVAPSKADDSNAANSAKAAPKPLYRDPVHDGAADPSLIWNRADKKWMMFYTNRSEEHTSELQSLRPLVCRLLL